MLSYEHLTQGILLIKDNKKFVVLKPNKTFFYTIEVKDLKEAKNFINKFNEKPKSQKLEEFVKILGIIKAKYSENYIICNEEKIISEKEIKKKKLDISPCCGYSAAEVFLKKKYRGRGFCKKCGRPFNIIKLEPDNWLSFSQELVFYQVNLINNDIREFYKMNLKEKKEIINEQTR
jgi:hypothetical protein